MGGRGLGIEGVHVHIRGHARAERRWVVDIRRDVFSISKTFTSVAVGIALAENLLDINDAVLSHLGHLAPVVPPGIDAITIRDLLTMSFGIVYRWHDPDADHPGDAARDILTTPLGAVPGATFAYRGANTYLLSRIINACSGQDLRNFLVPRLCTPLGIKNRSGIAARWGMPLARSGCNCAPTRSPDSAAPCWTMDGVGGGSASCFLANTPA